MAEWLNMYIYRMMVLSVFFISGFSSANQCINNQQDSFPESYISKINNHYIGLQAFRTEYQLAAKQRYYHYEAPEEERIQFSQEVLTNLTNDYLVSELAATTYNLMANAEQLASLQESIKTQISTDEKYTDSMQGIIDFYVCRAERKDLVQQLSRQLSERTSISESEIFEYYETYPEKFTTPVENRLGIILIGVNANAVNEEWQEAETLAKRIHLQLTEGAVFSKLAKRHSSDISARHGGDMGFQHRGILGELVENTVEPMEVGDISKPIFLLEGWTLIKLLDRNASTLNSYEKVKDRAKGLARTDKIETEWQELLNDLNAKSVIEIKSELFSE